MRSVVDLPAPLGPSSATSSPSATDRSMPRTASTFVFPRVKLLVKPVVSIITAPPLGSWIRYER